MNSNHLELAMDDEVDHGIADDANLTEYSSDSCYLEQISLAEYHKQATDYTKASVQSLISSPEYQRMQTRCQLCWCLWSEDQSSANCIECGGYAMSRPCPLCQGQCGAIWTRDVYMSHGNYEAHWDGDCLLPSEQKEGYLLQLLMTVERSDESDVIDAMQTLLTK